MADSEDIPMVLVRNQLKQEYGRTFLAYYDMKKPSSLPESDLLLNKKLPTVCMDLVLPTDLPRLSAMQSINHENVMRIEALKEVDIGDPSVKMLALLIDHHNGPLGVHLDTLPLYDNYGVVPSQALRDIIRQIISGLEELRKNGFYHGALHVNNIYVSKRAKLLIKLFNFQTRDISKEAAQLEDFVGVGLLLQQISSGLKLVKPSGIYTLIDDLASALLALTNIASLQKVEEMAFKKIFFWEPRRRIIFWIHDVPKALEKNGCDKIIRAHSWKLPWSSRTHKELLDEMNAYRLQEEQKKNAQVNKEDTKYKDNDALHYVKCISGAYTHEDKLKGKIHDRFGMGITVDIAVQTNDPELFITLYKILKDAGLIQD